MLRRIAVIAAATAAALVVGAAPVGAQQYPPSNNFLTIDDSTPTPGQGVTIGSGTYVPGSTVVISLATVPVTLGSPTAADNGEVSLQTTIPADTELGTHTITASGTTEDGPITQSITITVVGAEGTVAPVAGVTEDGGNLPKTGSNSTMPLVRAAALLLAVGGMLLLATRRRRAVAAAR
jgi:LPXTG-motif cell wall-anchored protein